MEPIGFIQGIFKWEEQEYTRLDTIKKSVFDRSRNIFYAVNFVSDPKMTNKGIGDTVIIDIVYDGDKPSKTLITDPHKINGGIILPFVTDYPGEVVWLGYFEVPGYKKYTKAGTHSVTIKVAPRKRLQGIRERDFSPEAGGVVERFVFELVEDRQGE